MANESILDRILAGIKNGWSALRERFSKWIHPDVLCPYCMKELRTRDIVYMCPSCGKQVKQNIVEWALVKAPVCRDPNCHGQNAKRHCPNQVCRKELPYDILQYKKNLRFALIGVTGSGKTNYLTTMITEARNTREFPMIMTWRDNQTKIHYMQNKKMLYEDKIRLASTPKGMQPIPQQWKLTPRDNAQNVEGVEKGNTTDVYSLTLFDGAGENCEHTDPVVSRYINGAHALIILFDPLVLKTVKERLPKEAINRSTTAAHANDDNSAMVIEIANYIRESCQIDINSPIDKDVAIVFTKIDEVFNNFEHETVSKPSPHTQAGGFDLKDADEVDREIRKWLLDNNEGSFLDAIEANFTPSRVRFFGVSSFGETPKDNGNPSSIEPHRVLDPLYWMLSLEGVIPVIHNRNARDELVPEAN